MTDLTTPYEPRLCPGCSERELPDHRDLCLFCLGDRDDGRPWRGSAKGEDWQAPSARRPREGA